MNISKEGIEITNRFFEALDILKRKSIVTRSAFSLKYGINRWNMHTVKWNPERSMLKPEWIAYLVRDYNVSAEWILLGDGPVLVEKQKKQNAVVRVSKEKLETEETRPQNEEPVTHVRKQRLSRYKDYPYKKNVRN